MKTIAKATMVVIPMYLSNTQLLAFGTVYKVDYEKGISFKTYVILDSLL